MEIQSVLVQICFFLFFNIFIILTFLTPFFTDTIFYFSFYVFYESDSDLGRCPYEPEVFTMAASVMNMGVK